MRVVDIPIVFLSYDEPWADAFFADLKSKAPWARRVHGVAGLDACHKAAAREANARWFITVDADTLVDKDFFAASIPDEYLNDLCRIEWSSRNIVNGLTYGNGSLKCWPRDLVNKMRTHEAAPTGSRSVDHDIGTDLSSGQGSQRIQLPEIYSQTHPAETPFHGFRCGFREGVRLGLKSGRQPGEVGFAQQISTWHGDRVKVWCTVGGHARNGNWLIYGARLGLLMGTLLDWDFQKINDYDWFDRLWRDMILPRLAGQSESCNQSGMTWDGAKLQLEITGLGDRIRTELNFEVADVSTEVSAFMYDSVDRARLPTIVDTMGYMYLKGYGLSADREQAMEYFQIGMILNLAASFNNMARLREQTQGTGTDRDAAQIHYEMAIAMDNRFAPYHLARMLAKHSDGSDESEARINYLVALSAARGFAPDQPPEVR